MVFDGFVEGSCRTRETEIVYRIGGAGLPVLLLHGFPQSHVIWHRVAPLLARRFTVVCADLRGYGASGKPPSGADHVAYSKRAMALDMVELMTSLGHERFALVGHDRGGRVAHRLALDHPERLDRLAVLDIAPTRTVFGATDQALATGYYHWFFLIQPHGLPERLIGAEPDFYLEQKLGAWGGSGLDVFTPEALDAYRRCMRDPATLHAMCEDYRAAATIDLEHDEADLDRRIACPLLVLWGERGLMHRRFDVLATWRGRASGPVLGEALPCGHFLPEEQPERTAELLGGFLAG